MPRFLVHRASKSLCIRRLQFSSRPSGSAPFLIASFSLRRLRCRGTSTNEASAICPLRMMKPPVPRPLPEISKKRLGQIGFYQAFAEQADGVLVRDRIRIRQAQKAVETAAVQHLKRGLLVRQGIKGLQDRNFEHGIRFKSRPRAPGFLGSARGIRSDTGVKADQSSILLRLSKGSRGHQSDWLCPAR